MGDIGALSAVFTTNSWSNDKTRNLLWRNVCATTCCTKAFFSLRFTWLGLALDPCVRGGWVSGSGSGSGGTGSVAHAPPAARRA